MFEETNQTAAAESQESQATESVANQDGEDLFGEEGAAESNTETKESEGAVGENQTGSTEENKGEEGQKTDSEGKPTGTETENLVPIKFNGQVFNVPNEAIEALAKSLNIPVEQAQVLMQKGMNYDHVKSEVDQDRETLEFYAQQNGMTVPQYMKALREQREAAGIQAEEKALTEKYPDENPEIIKMLAEMQFKQKQKDAESAVQQQKQDEDAKKDKMFAAFVKAYPDVKELPPEVVQKMNEGEDLTAAYTAFENKSLKEKLANIETQKKVEEKNQNNKETALGSLEGDNSNTERDPFMEGLNSR
jgi:hypothetical protein